ncbi:vascular cell adhesion protein 1-like [Notolabrus celidotus]|uniref:vascular cell adhesion protein 1-like n=1 Tax=Notolabrus celidotus TaxID=1203425 RepID=UPI00148F4F08|nr:vascular cell adhesion protein 1-like [Notolabrus celidotus]
MMIANFFLSVLFVSGAHTACPGQADLSIAAPKTVQALSGSCLQVPCNFTATSGEETDSTGNISGVWIKSDPRFAKYPDNVVFNSSRRINNYTMSLTGNLREKNCTTLFSNVLTSYTDRYFFRIESSTFTATASCDPLHITVKDSPPSPRIEIPAGDLKEEESVTITCSALTPCPHSPPKLTWSLQRDSLNNIEENTDGTFTTQIQESITLSEHHDGYNITCSATYPVNEGRDVRTAEETKTLSVSYAPKNTSVSISPSGLVSAGTVVNLTCSSRAKPPVSRFTWFRTSNNRPVMVSEGESYSLNVTEGRVYYCVATSDLGEGKSSDIHLHIKGADSSSPLGAVVGSMIGIIVLISVVVIVWWLKSKRSALQQTQSPTDEEPAVQEQARASENEDIHYGEIDFSKLRSEPSSNPEQESGQQQDTLYAQVKVSKPGISVTQAAAGAEELYAQVKRT